MQGMTRNAVMTVGIIIALAAIVWIVAQPNTAAPEPEQQATASSTAAAAQASVEFKDLMDIAKQSGLVASFEFSNTARVIYVTDIWSDMTVAFKKDFLAKVATLQKLITGHMPHRTHWSAR